MNLQKKCHEASSGSGLYAVAKTRQRGRAGESGVISSRSIMPPLHSRHLTWRTSYAEHGKPVLFLLGRHIVRYADNSVGKGCWKKRMQCCNDADTGLNVTWHENGQTSDWSLFA